MQYFRSLIYTVLSFGTVPFFVIPAALLIPLPYRVRYAWLTLWAQMSIWLLKVVCNLRYEVHGRENIPPQGSIIFCKHQSMWETMALQCVFPPQLWVVKRELMWVPFFGWALWMLESIPIDRSSGRKAVNQVVNHGCDRLKKGRWVVIYPEGTRVAPGVRQRYKMGGALLAEKSGYPVVPVAHNAGEFWSRRSFLKKPGCIQVIIGPAIDSRGKTAVEINQLAEDFIEGEMEKISHLEIRQTAVSG